MGILGKQKVINYLSIPIVICGLFLTFLVDFVLYQEESRIGREVFTTTAFHRMSNLYEYVYRYETAAQIIDSSIRESGGRIDGIKGLPRLMEINRSFRLMELIPEEGESLSYKSDRWLGTGRSLLEGPLKEAAERARTSGRWYWQIPFSLIMGGRIWRCCSRYFWRRGRVPISGAMC